MKINDIRSSLIDEKSIINTCKINHFTLEILKEDQTYEYYKYNNEQLIDEDIKSINLLCENMVLYG